MDIAGRVALVTGASVGSGRAIARRLLEAGAEVVSADAGAAPRGGRHPPLDVTPDATVEEWSAMLALNLRAPMLATQRMREGVVINIASSAGAGDEPHASPEYSAAKAGLIRFSTAVRMPGVRVNCVVPDWLLTEPAREELAAMSAEQRAAAPE